METTEGSVKPITFEEVYDAKCQGIPNEIVLVVNKLIKENFNTSDNSSKVYQDDILNEITIEKERVYRNHWLDIEPLYESAGWDVSYYHSACWESFPSYFVFSKK